MAHQNHQAYQTSQMVEQPDCPDCNRRSDWDFLKDFYQKHDVAIQEIQALREHVFQLNSALHYAGTTSQKDRIALNTSHHQIQELEAAFNESQTTRVRLQDELDVVRQEHQVCHENFDLERSNHRATERTLESVWAAHFRLGEIMSDVLTDEGTRDQSKKNVNVAELVLEVEAKSFQLQTLNSQLEQAKQEYDANLHDFKEKLHTPSTGQPDNLSGLSQHIDGLERRLRQERANKTADENGLAQVRAYKKPRTRATVKVEASAQKKGVNEGGDAKKAGLRDENMLPIIKEEP